jgi:type I restriction enzyme S subunit
MVSEVSLQSVCELVVDCPHSTPEWTSVGPIVLRSKNIRGGRLDLSHTDEKHYELRIKRAEPRAGDIVITREAPMGECAMIPEGLKCCLGQRMVLLRPDRQRIDSRYLLFALQAPAVQWQIGMHEGTGSTVSNLRIPALEALSIRVPTLGEQRAIGSILGALDDKIELNQEMSRTLDQTAQMIFNSWFAGTGEHDAGGSSHVALDRLVTMVKGRSYMSAELAESRTALVTLKSFARNGGYRPDGLKSYTGSYRPEQVIEPGEVVVALTDVTQAADVIGNPAVVLPDEGHSTLVASLDTAIVRPIAGLPRAFVYFVMRSPAFKQHARAHTTGTTVLHLKADHLLAYPVPRFDEDRAEEFGETVRPIMERIICCDVQSRIIAKLRDTLLPGLLSGSLSVAGAEKAVEEVV